MSGITNGYVSEDTVTKTLHINTSSHDEAVRDAINDASREIDLYCGRSFYVGPAGSRVFWPFDGLTVSIDDVPSPAAIVSVATDTAGDGTYATVWAASDYLCEPLNQVVAGYPGWPVTHLRSTSARWFPLYNRYRPPLQVTTTAWGWLAVPDPVAKACSVLVSAILGQDQSPGGIVGASEFGTIRLPNDQFRLVERKLRPFTRLGGNKVGGFA